MKPKETKKKKQKKNKNKTEMHRSNIYVRLKGGARGVTVTVVGNGHGDPSSNPGRGYFNFALH